MRNEFIDKLRAIFGGQDVNIPDGNFPYRTQVPLLLGVSAVATFTHMERLDRPDDLSDSTGRGGRGENHTGNGIFAVPASDFNEIV